jgi:hypothetical protein
MEVKKLLAQKCRQELHKDCDKFCAGIKPYVKRVYRISEQVDKTYGRFLLFYVDDIY